VGSAGQALGHAQGEAEIDGQGEPGAGSEQRAGERIEDGGIDQAGVRGQLVTGDGEVRWGGENGVGEGADGGGSQRAGLGAEHEDGAGLVFFGQLAGADKISRGAGPGRAGGRSGDDADGRIEVFREGVRGSDDQALGGERSGEADEYAFELLRGHGGQQHEESVAGSGGGGGDFGN